MYDGSRAANRERRDKAFVNVVDDDGFYSSVVDVHHILLVTRVICDFGTPRMRKSAKLYRPRCCWTAHWAVSRLHLFLLRQGNKRYLKSYVGGA